MLMKNENLYLSLSYGILPDVFSPQTQAYSHSSQKQDDREKIQWVKFEEGDLNGKKLCPVSL